MSDRHPFRPFLLASALIAAALGGAPEARAQGLSGTLVVVNKGPSTLSIVDLASGALVGRVPTGKGPHEVVLTSDGATAVVTDYGARSGGNTLTVVDVPSASVARTVDLGRHRRPHGIAVMPGDEIVAVTSEASNHVILVRIADGEIVGEIPTGHPGSHMLAVPAGADAIYTSNGGDDTASSLDPATLSHELTLRVPASPEAIGVTPDGSELWVGSNDEGSVVVFETDPWSEGEIALREFGWPYRIVFTPDQRLVLIPDLGRHELRIVDRASREALEVLEFPGAGPQGITVTDDGRVAFLSLSQEGRVVAIDLATRQVVASYEVGERPDGIAYTPRTVPPPAR